MATVLSSSERRAGRAALAAAIASAIALGACSHADGTRPLPTTGQTAEPIGEIDPRFVADVKEAFAAYKAWGRVDDEMRWAPFLCRMPMPGRPAMSAAADGAHAKKLYSLFAKEHGAYAELGNAYAPNTKLGVPLGPQIVAKESYLPELVTEAPNALKSTNGMNTTVEADHFHPYATGEDGKTYRASQLAGVYFVIEKGAGTPGTDDGFVYGTVTASGEVTSAGKVTSCMGCHVQAKHRRLFGPVKHTF